MSNEQVMDDETQMAEALAELRSERTEAIETPAPAHVAEAPAPAVATAEKDTSTEAQPSVADAKPDPADELRKVQEELHRARSEVGRVNALNRLYNETRQRLESLERENAAFKARPVADQGEVKSAAMNKLAEVAEKVKDFPELSGLVAAVGEALQSVDTKAEQVAKHTAAQVIQPLEGLRVEAEQRRQQEQQAAYQAAMQTFQSTYPTAVDVIKTPDFKSWIATAPKQVQQAYQEGTSPDEAIAVLDAFDAHLRRVGKSSIAQYQTQAQPAPAAAEAKTSASSKDRLAQAVGIHSRASGAKGGLPAEDDFDGALAFFRQQRLRRAAA